MKSTEKQTIGKSLLGDLNVHKKLLRRAKSVNQNTTKIPKVLKITIVEAYLIRDTEIFSKMDPYVIMTYGGTVMKTDVHEESGTHPVWNKTFEINYQSTSDIISFSVFDEDKFQDEIIGRRAIKLETLLEKDHLDKHFYLFFEGE